MTALRTRVAERLREAPDAVLTRLEAVRKAPKRIDPEGGIYSAGLIESAAIVTVGEALGHGFWLDEEFVDAVRLAIGDSDNGVKVRYTHPDMSSDGMGKHLGRATDAKRSGDVVKADLHFTETSHASPDGDLSGYVMSLADESPSDFGMSIVFSRDRGAMDEHRGKYSDKDGNFKSPDKRNKKNLPHMRLAELHGVDVVDEPAANPGGMFHRGPAVEFEQLAAYALGLREDAPECHAFNIHPDRVKLFINRFLRRNGLQIVSARRRLARSIEVNVRS